MLAYAASVALKQPVTVQRQNEFLLGVYGQVAEKLCELHLNRRSAVVLANSIRVPWMYP